MRVEITTSPGIFAEGSLIEGILSQHGAPHPHIVIEMKVTGSNDPVKVTLDENDLSMIIRIAKSSTVQRIRAAVG